MPLEDARNVLLADALAVVLHLDQDPVEHVAEPDVRRAALAAVVDRVDDEIDQHLTDVVLVGQHPEGRRQVAGTLHANADMLAVGLHLGLLRDLARQRHDVELLHLQAVHAAFELRNGIEVVHDVDEPVDALLGPFEELAVDQLVLQTAVEQGRDIALDIENGGFQLVGHIAEVLLAEALRLLETRDLLVVRVGPGGQLLADVLHTLVLELIEDFGRVHVAREDDRIDRLQLVGHVFANDEQRREHHDAERSERQHQHIEPRRLQRDADRRDEQRSALLGLDRDHAAPIYSVP